MKAKDLREKTAEELAEELVKLRREQFNLRMQAATGQGAKRAAISAISSGGVKGSLAPYPQ